MVLTKPFNRRNIMSEDRTLELVNIQGIRMGGTLITPETLEADVQRWHGYALLPGIGEDNMGMNDEQLLRQLCFELMPFALTADEPLVLRAEVMRYPYSINGNRAFQGFACRLMPESGRITKLETHANTGLAINSQTCTGEGVTMDLGNGALYLEVYFEPHDQAGLPPLRPPMGHREEVVLDPADAID